MNNSDNLTIKFGKNDTLCMKALAVMLMLCHHLFAFPDKIVLGTLNPLITFSDGSTLAWHVGNYGKLCVALFMLLSGYGVYISYTNNEKNIGKTITRRLKNAYFKYWQVFAFMIPIGIIIGSEKINTELGALLKNFLAIETTFNDEWWFMTLYVIMLFFFPIAIRWIDRKRAEVFKDFFILVAFNALAYTFLYSLLELPLFTSFNGTYFADKMKVCFAMLAMFVAGCLLAKYQIIEKILTKVNNTIARILLGIAIITTTVVLRTKWSMACMWGWDRLDFIYASLFVIGCTLIIYNLNPVKKVLALIGAQSTGIWLIHTFLCYYYCQEFTYILKNPILVFIMTLALSYALSYGISFVFKQLGKLKSVN